MSDVLARAEPIPTAPWVGRDVTIRLAPPAARFSLRARKAADVQDALGREVTGKIGTTINGIACLGPEEWLWRAPEGTATPANARIAITDIGHRHVGLIVEGPRAVSVLSAGCPLDLATFEVGRATRTVFETVEIIIEREAPDRFHVEVWRSLSVWLWMALTTTAGD